MFYIMVGEKILLFPFWVVISLLLLTLELILHNAKWLIHELIYHVWLKIRFNNLKARHKTNPTKVRNISIQLCPMPTPILFTTKSFSKVGSNFSRCTPNFYDFNPWLGRWLGGWVVWRGKTNCRTVAWIIMKIQPFTPSCSLIRKYFTKKWKTKSKNFIGVIIFNDIRQENHWLCANQDVWICHW